MVTGPAWHAPASSRISKHAAEQANHYFQKGLIAHRRGLIADATRFYIQALRHNPEHLDCLNLSAQLAYQSKDYELSLSLMETAVRVQPTIAASHSNMGLVLHELGRFDEALACYEKALALLPGYADALNNRGNSLKALGKLEEAINSYELALSANPQFAEAVNNLGNVFLDLSRAEEALACFERALTYRPHYVEAYNNRGNALLLLQRYQEALSNYENALTLNPSYERAINNIGNTLRELKRPTEAISFYDKALAFNPNYAAAYLNKGIALSEIRNWEGALSSFEAAYSLEPEYPYLLGTLLNAKTMLCDWDGISALQLMCEEGVSNGKKTVLPFFALSLFDSPALQNMAARTYVETFYPKAANRIQGEKHQISGKVRIGYYSADFHNHATCHLMVRLFELHDKEHFELVGFSFGPDTRDEMRQRIVRAFDRFIDVRERNDREIAQMSRELGIDIAVDLKGFTKDERFGIFVERCAPIQVSYLGYPGTLGADCIDYVIADQTVVPHEEQPYYTEKVVSLPYSYQVNDESRPISNRTFTRRELGLPESGFVYCCFNKAYKILPTVFDRWMRILATVEGSVLWLLEDTPTTTTNLRREAESRGVNGERLIFASRLPPDEHLARHRLADLFLDTLPYNAHTTASDALWAGLPVLTCKGNSFPGRVAASLLTAIELPELITDSLDDYEQKAIELANNTTTLRGIRKKLETNKYVTPLFNTRLFTRHLEAAYQQIALRSQAGLLPENIFIAP